MTAAEAAERETLVFDTTVLHHFARADRLADLADLTSSRSCATTVVVLAELRSGVGRHPELTRALTLDWVTVIALDQLAEIRCFGEWVRRIGAGEHDRGRRASSPPHRCDRASR